MLAPWRRRRTLSAVPLLAAVLALGCGVGKQLPGASAPPDPGSTAPPATPASTAPSATPAPSAGTSPIPPASAGAPASSGAGGRSTATGAEGTPPGVAPAHPVPAAFRPAPGAASDEEVRAELAQMSAVERRARLRALSAAAADLAGLLPWSLEPKSGVRESVASVFTDYALGLACGGVLGRHELGVAHKTAPCGTLITFTYGGRSVTVPVIDRGPYIAGREWDLTGATAEALGFPGLGEIRWSLAR